MKNYTYVSDYAIVIITAENGDEAYEILKATVKESDRFGLQDEDGEEI